MSFITELWESVFTPGTTPALMKATHTSFILLITSLVSLVYLTRSIHFFNLLVISLFLYATVVWFVNELKDLQLKDNEELSKEQSNEEAARSKKGSMNEFENATGAQPNPNLNAQDIELKDRRQQKNGDAVITSE